MLVILFQLAQLIVLVGFPVAAIAWLAKEFLRMRRDLRLLAARVDALAPAKSRPASLPPHER